MCDIKLITRETEFKEIHLMDWDAYNKDIALHVYRIPGYIHSIGGRWGNNNYWCCPRGEKPTYENLYEFSGNVCNWGIKINESNYHKFKWNEHEILDSIRVEIIRNNKKFYHFNVNNFDYGFAKARKLLFEIHEHPISFNEINYQNQIIGRKIYFDKMPCLIDSYTVGSDRIIVKPDLNVMSIKEWHKNLDEYFEGDEMIGECLFSHSINWFRE